MYAAGGSRGYFLKGQHHTEFFDNPPPPYDQRKNDSPPPHHPVLTGKVRYRQYNLNGADINV